jgi:hypothetical protein
LWNNIYAHLDAYLCVTYLFLIVPVRTPADTPVSFLIVHDFSLHTIQDLFLNYFAYCNFRELQVQLETTQPQTLRIHILSKCTSAMMMWCSLVCFRDVCGLCVHGCDVAGHASMKIHNLNLCVWTMCIWMWCCRMQEYEDSQPEPVCGLKCVLYTTSCCGFLFLVMWILGDGWCL